MMSPFFAFVIILLCTTQAQQLVVRSAGADIPSTRKVLSNGFSICEDDISPRGISVVCELPGGAQLTGKVTFSVNGANVQTESFDPYAINGDGGVENVNKWNPPSGQITVACNAPGVGSASASGVFSCSSGSNPPPVNSPSLVVRSAGADIPSTRKVLSNGFSICEDDISPRGISVVCELPGGAQLTGKVTFSVNGANVQTESFDPYAINGDGGVENVNKWNPPSGQITVACNAPGVGSASASGVFSCSSGSNPPPAPAPPSTGGAMAAVTDYCPSQSDVFINSGGSHLSSGYRCDKFTKGYFNAGTKTFSSSLPLAGDCTAQYNSHRWSSATLLYTVPVPPGTYTVTLQFMENFFNMSDQRVFTAFVNGNPVEPPGSMSNQFDIFALAGGKGVPYALSVITTDDAGFIKVSLGNVAGKDHPMISAVGISGVSGSVADGVIGTAYAGTCNDPPAGGPAPPQPAPLPPAPEPPTLPQTPIDDPFVCPGLNDFLINAGGSFAPGDIRCDTGKYFSGNVKKSATSGVTLAGACSDQYKVHRFAFPGDLNFNLPVASGSYTVLLQFMDTFANAANVRVFSIAIEGKTAVHPLLTNGEIDLFVAAGGKNKPLMLAFENVAVTDGSLTMKFGKVKENPMVSGIFVFGNGATSVVGSEFVNTCMDMPQPTDCPNLAFSDSEDADHVAHAVSGGPYIETDFDKDGTALVQLDGLGSHSHNQNPTQGFINKYEWSWTQNGMLKKATGGRPQVAFPLGTTQLNLTVLDQFCNAAYEATTVTVSSATSPGAYCYYYDFEDSMPTVVDLPVDLNDNPKPKFAQQVNSINFGTTASFGNFTFNQGTFAVRCVLSVLFESQTTTAFTVQHNGPIKVYDASQLVAQATTQTAGTQTAIPSKTYAPGLATFQIMYLRQNEVPGQLVFQPSQAVSYDASTILPVIGKLSDTTAFSNDIINVDGSAFVNGVQVKFGNVIGQPITSSATSISVRVPPQQGAQNTVLVTIETLAGVSNGVEFTYGVSQFQCEQVDFETVHVKTTSGGIYAKPKIAVIKYGPDGRLYGGSTNSQVWAWTISKELVVTDECQATVPDPAPHPKNTKDRNILGIAFDYKVLTLRMYFTSNTFYWGSLIDGVPRLNFTYGWRNGMVESVTFQGDLKNCFDENSFSPVVTGLPVSNHDHGINFLQFLPDGRLLIAVGGFTNGGISVPNDKLGGVPAPPYAGAIITCPYKNGVANVKYTNLNNPDLNSAASDDSGCKVYATGFRNTFGAEYHSNGNLFATDNGGNAGFGEFSTSCNTGASAVNTPDRLLKVQENACHGHAHRPRGECINDWLGTAGSGCLKPIASGLKPSTNAVLEYRSNFFAGKVKGNIIMSRVAFSFKTGNLHRLELTETGDVKKLTKNYKGDSGISLVEGPRGEIINARLFNWPLSRKPPFLFGSFMVYKPKCAQPITGMYLIGVHPRRGPPSGGHKVVVHGFNFGPAPDVFFGAKQATVLSVTADGEAITCETPPNVSGTQVKVTVQSGGGVNQVTQGSDYWYW